MVEKEVRNSFMELNEVQGGYYQYGVNTNNFSTESQYTNNGGYEPNIGNGENLGSMNRNYLDLSTGLNFIKEDTNGRQKFFLGISAQHLNEPYRSLVGNKDNLAYMFFIHSGVRVFANQYWSVVPEILFANQSSYRRYTLGVKATYSLQQENNILLNHASIAFIPKYTHNNSLALGLELQVSTFLVAFNYDFATSSLANRMSGTAILN